MKIQSGEYEVIFSGTVIGVINEEIYFQFPDTHASLKFILAFKNDKSIEGSPIQIDVLGEKTMKLTLVNINGTMGSGNTQLLELGSLQNRGLFLNYRVYTIKEISHTIHYTFYLGKEVRHAR